MCLTACPHSDPVQMPTNFTPLHAVVQHEYDRQATVCQFYPLSRIRTPRNRRRLASRVSRSNDRDGKRALHSIPVTPLIDTSQTRGGGHIGHLTGRCNTRRRRRCSNQTRHYTHVARADLQLSRPEAGPPNS